MPSAPQMKGGVRTIAQLLPPNDLSRFLYSRALTYFMAVADSLSIRAASRRLNIASSAVNRQILQLEEAIGTPLFERHGRSLTLSPAGELLADHARKALIDLRAALDDVEALRGVRGGVVHIASIESFASGLLSSIVLAFSRRNPFTKISVSVQPSREIHNLVAKGEAEIGFTINPPGNAPFVVAAKYDVSVGAIVAPDHPLAKRSAVTIAECLEYPVLRGQTPKIWSALNKVSQRKHIMKVIESNSSRFKAALVRQGNFVAFSPSFAIEPQILDGSLVFIPVEGSTATSDCFGIIAHSRKLPPAPASFLEFSCQMIAEHQQLFSPPAKPRRKRARS